jgi:hypothetical protein
MSARNSTLFWCATLSTVRFCFCDAHAHSIHFRLANFPSTLSLSSLSEHLNLCVCVRVGVVSINGTLICLQKYYDGNLKCVQGVIVTYEVVPLSLSLALTSSEQLNRRTKTKSEKALKNKLRACNSVALSFARTLSLACFSIVFGFYQKDIIFKYCK